VKARVKEKTARDDRDPSQDEGKAERVGGKVKKKVGDIEKDRRKIARKVGPCFRGTTKNPPAFTAIHRVDSFASRLLRFPGFQSHARFSSTVGSVASGGCAR